MPIVTVDLLEGRSPEQKQKLATALTSCFVDVLKSDAKDVTILLRESERSHWFIGGIGQHKPK